MAYVLVARSDHTQIVGYFTLAATAVSIDAVPATIVKGFPRYPLVPATLVGRLAVRQSSQKQGLGQHLLMAALERSLAASHDIASTGVVVDAKDEAAAAFYRRYNVPHLSRRPPPALSADGHHPAIVPPAPVVHVHNGRPQTERRRAWSSSSSVTKCFRLRPSRSRRQHTKTSKRRRRPSASRRSSAGRRSLAPDTPRSTYSATVQPRATTQRRSGGGGTAPAAILSVQSANIFNARGRPNRVMKAFISEPRCPICTR